MYDASYLPATSRCCLVGRSLHALSTGRVDFSRFLAIELSSFSRSLEQVRALLQEAAAIVRPSLPRARFCKRASSAVRNAPAVLYAFGSFMPLVSEFLKGTLQRVMWHPFDLFANDETAPECFVERLFELTAVGTAIFEEVRDGSQCAAMKANIARSLNIVVRFAHCVHIDVHSW